MLDTTALRDAYRVLLEAAATVADSKTTRDPAPGEWNADQILSHVSLVTAMTIAAASAVAAGAHTTYDNRFAQDTWTIGRVIELTGDSAGLRDRVQRQAELLCGFGSPALSDPELDTLVPARLLSASTLLVDQPLPLRDLITGLAASELPGHTEQLLALLDTR
ncbi:DinB family protein [Nocardia sp. XZ_19_385]|uniref:DinB family protein n=1 Tax=Nocardia sp. XZ_19_385 TaxID=2769488 RepID=UPI00188DEB28|nr:DinB family protein [Nocardia sp. XZ_19_385]